MEINYLEEILPDLFGPAGKMIDKLLKITIIKITDLGDSLAVALLVHKVRNIRGSLILIFKGNFEEFNLYRICYNSITERFLDLLYWPILSLGLVQTI